MRAWWRRSSAEGATVGDEDSWGISVGAKKKALTMTQEVKDRWSETVKAGTKRNTIGMESLEAEQSIWSMLLSWRKKIIF